MRDTVYSEEWLADRLMQNRTRSREIRETSGGETPTDKVDATPSKSKYNSKKTVIDGETFDSKKEAARYQDLLIRQRAGEVRDLTRQVRMPLEIDGFLVCVYICDFRYEEWVSRFGWQKRHEDVKGMRTPVYLLKKKLVKALLKIEILET